MLTQFRNLTDDELIRFALSSVEASPLAVELAQRLDYCLNECESEEPEDE